jgi:hypothetical protein
MKMFGIVFLDPSTLHLRTGITLLQQRLLFSWPYFFAGGRRLAAGFRIRIHLIRIRIQRLRLETNPDPDPIRIQGFNDQKLKKN